MKIDTSLGTYEDVFKESDANVAEIAQYIHNWIIEFDPEVVIVPRAGEKSVAYGIGPKKMSEAYCYIMPQKGYLNLGFYHGTSLPDPSKLLEGTGNKLRHIKLRNIEQVKSEAVSKLLTISRKDRVESKQP